MPVSEYALFLPPPKNKSNPTVSNTTRTIIWHLNTLGSIPTKKVKPMWDKPHTTLYYECRRNSPPAATFSSPHTPKGGTWRPE